jgi:hypothetical protein
MLVRLSQTEPGVAVRAIRPIEWLDEDGDRGDDGDAEGDGGETIEGHLITDWSAASAAVVWTAKDRLDVV